uniref:Sphingomyelin phosphodiesterase n=3 Tax=Photinus pyralis TaxID=7054 RepID=A0A1Y1N7Y8_PHOPY
MRVTFLLLLTIFFIVVQKSLCDPLVLIEEGITEYFRTRTRPGYLENSIREALIRTSSKLGEDGMHCALCRIVTKIVIEYRRAGTNNEIIGDIGKDLCTLFADIGYVTCVGYIDLTIDTFVFIIDNKPDITPERFCAIRLQEYGCVDPNYVPWRIDLPPGRSPSLPRRPSGQTTSVLHLTDIHYDPLYQPESNADCEDVLCCEITSGIPKQAIHEAGFWGDYRPCDMPWQSFENLLSQVKNKHRIDSVYLTGDIISHQVWNTSKEYNQLYITQVLEKIQHTFGTTPVYPILGNHEAHPTDFYPPNSVEGDFSISWLLDYVAEEWSRWLPTSTLTTIRQGGFYTVLVKPGFRIIALNSNVCFTNNIWLVYDDVDPYNQLQWLSDTLLEAEKNQEAVHILSHIPPGDIECSQQWSHEFRRIIERFHNTITGQFNGHTHNDEFKVFFSQIEKDKVINVAFNGGSFTTYVGLNPNYKVYTLEVEDGRMLESEQWTFNLSEANQDPYSSPKWYKLYSFSDIYGFEPFNLPQYQNLIHNMSINEQLLQNYHRLQVRNSTAALRTKCEDGCLRNLFCGIISVEYEDLIECRKQKQSGVHDEL